MSGEFGERRIEGHAALVMTCVEPDVVSVANGTQIAYDELISFPPCVVRMTYPSLPSGDRGFIRTEPATRRVDGLHDVHAPGDAGDFPVTQASSAFLQADAVSEAIAAEVHGGAPRATFDPVSMCVMGQFDRATFARSP